LKSRPVLPGGSFLLPIINAFHLTSFSRHSTLKGFVPAESQQAKPKGAIPQT